DLGESLNEEGNDTGPAGLMAGPNPCTGVSVEILVEQDVVAPVLIVPPAMIAVGRPASLLVADEQARQPSRDLLTDLQEIQLAPRADWALDLEVVAQVGVLVDQGADEHELHRHPDRSAPVGVPPKHPAVRIARDVTDPVLLSANVEDIGVLGVIARHRA